MSNIKIKKISKNSQIRINRTDTIKMYLKLAKEKYKVLDDNEIIKIWIGKGINEDFGDESEANLLAKKALDTFIKDEDDQDNKTNYNSKKLKKVSW
jgi:hypothetical protein